MKNAPYTFKRYFLLFRILSNYHGYILCGQWLNYYSIPSLHLNSQHFIGNRIILNI